MTINKFFVFGLLVALFVVFSGCSFRVVDFTIISSKNHSLGIDKSKGVQVEGKSLTFLGLGATIKDAMDNALESAGPDYDLLIDGVVFRKDYFWVAGFSVKGTAIRSREMRAMLGEEGFQKWCEENNVFDAEKAIAEK